MNQNQLRNFQRQSSEETPGPSAYITPHDPAKILPQNQRPLSNQQSFNDIGSFEKAARDTIFSGKFKQYAKEFIPDMDKTGEKMGPGPAKYNIRDNQEKVDQGKTLQRTFSKSKRLLGEPNPSVEYQAKPGQYERLNIKDGMSIK